MALNQNANAARVLYHDKFDGKGFTNENSLANALLTKPDKISPVITHLQGREDKKFPLTFLTEGQKGGMRKIEINTEQYEWDTFEKLRKSDRVKSHSYAEYDKVGLTNTEFVVVFETNWIKQQHLVVSPNGIQCRVSGVPRNVGNGYEYRLRLINPDPANFINPTSELYTGAAWSMVGGAPVAESLSMGNESNVVMPGKMRNQISFLRKSYHIAGNIANKTVEVQFNINGKSTNMWMPFEEWQHMLNWKQDVEEHLWYSEYNRRPDGTIPLKDDVSGLAIPIGAGVFQQIPNRDTYSVLTAKKIKTTVADVMYGATDTGSMNVVLYTGEGGAEEFDNAMKSEASGFSLVTQSNVGDKFVTGSGRNLVYGGYFTQYQHVDGHTITLKRLPLFDLGGRAENSPKHPVTGKPLESYRMVFLDQSMYDGEQNVQMVTQKGRSIVRGVVKGMSPVPINWGGNSEGIQQIATEQDKSSLHYLCSKGVCIRRNTHCFELLCDIS